MCEKDADLEGFKWGFLLTFYSRQTKLWSGNRDTTSHDLYWMIQMDGEVSVGSGMGGKRYNQGVDVTQRICCEGCAQTAVANAATRPSAPANPFVIRKVRVLHPFRFYRRRWTSKDCIERFQRTIARLTYQEVAHSLLVSRLSCPFLSLISARTLHTRMQAPAFTKRDQSTATWMNVRYESFSSIVVAQQLLSTR